MKRWTQILKALANINRLKIVKLLSEGPIERHVGSIAREIHVTFQGTSRHLGILYGIGILDNHGRNGHVYYSLKRKLPRDLQKAVHLILNNS